MDPAKAALSALGACAFGLTFVPYPLKSKLDACIRDLWEKLFSTADPFTYIEVGRKSKGIIASNTSARQNPNAFANIALTSNPFYSEVSLYLGSLNIEFATRRVCVYGMDLGDDHDRPLSASSKFVFGLPLNETLNDTYKGAQFSWTHTAASNGQQSTSPDQNDEDENHVFTLKMLKADKQQLLHPYLNHISAVAHKIREKNTLPTLYTNGRHGSHWSSVTLKHPSTFETIALDGDMAERIQADLKAFSESEAYYHRIGRAWKRGYLLYGPPGTGKSSLIAAIANYMHYDIYNLELSNVFNNSGLQNLLMQTTRKSIIVIEDIDCSMSTRFSERRDGISMLPHQVVEEPHSSSSQGFTLSGLLNFADGLLSCYGEERIFIFTTNHKERLDSALLRCGRMDMHIHLSYCTFSVFKKLAVNYLGVWSHALYGELEEAMSRGVKITPAAIAEILISEKKRPDEAMKQVIAAVKQGEPLDADDEGKLEAGTTNTAANLKRRKLSTELPCEESARKKRQVTSDVYAADPSAAKDIEHWSSREESEEDAGDLANAQDMQAAAKVEEQMEDEMDGRSSGLQSGELRETADGVVEEREGDTLEVTIPSEPMDSANVQYLDARKCDREAFQARSDITTSEFGGGYWQGMTIDDSEESSDEGSEKLGRARLPPSKAEALCNSTEVHEWVQKHAKDRLQGGTNKLRPRRILD